MRLLSVWFHKSGTRVASPLGGNERQAGTRHSRAREGLRRSLLAGMRPSLWLKAANFPHIEVSNVAGC